MEMASVDIAIRLTGDLPLAGSDLLLWEAKAVARLFKKARRGTLPLGKESARPALRLI